MENVMVKYTDYVNNILYDWYKRSDAYYTGNVIHFTMVYNSWEERIDDYEKWTAYLTITVHDDFATCHNIHGDIVRKFPLNKFYDEVSEWIRPD